MRGVVGWGNLQQIRVAEKYLEYFEEARDQPPEVVWVVGPPGSGKSRFAREYCAMLDYDDIYTKNSGTKWWPGYDGHEAVIIDDFRDSWWSLTYMLGLIDRYEFLVELKGSTRQFKPKLIVITSIFKPKNQYANAQEDPAQLLRRLTGGIYKM